MKRRLGQAGLIIGEALHQLGRIAILALVLVLVSICLLGFRLSQGPILLPALASRLATAVSGRGINIEMQQAELNWAGYQQGGGVPIYLRLGDITVRNGVGVTLVSIPTARLKLLPSALMGANAPLLVEAGQAQFAGSSVPVSLQASIWPGRDFNFARADVQVTLGAGRLGVGGNSLPVDSGGFELKVMPGAADLSEGYLNMSRVGESKPRMTVSATAILNSQWNFTIAASLDAVNAKDLSAYWPQVAIPPARAWVLKNITAGSASNANFTFSLTAPGDLGDLRFAGLTGRFDARDLTLIWLEGATPITALNGSMVFQDQNNALVTATSARLGGLVINKGRFALSQMSMPLPTIGTLDVSVGGSIPAAIAVLNAPPLSLLRQAPPQLARASGDVSADVAAVIPLINKLQLRDTGLNVNADLRNVAFDSGVAGLGFSAGNGRLDVTPDGLTAKAGLQFAGEPAQLDARVSFAGAAGAEDMTLTSLAGPVLLRRFGLDAAEGVAGGAAPYSLRITGGATGAQSARLKVDLTPAGLSAAHFGWEKPAGAMGHLDLTATLENGNFAALESIDASAPGLDVQGEGQGRRMLFSTMNIGRTIASGELSAPAGPGAPWVANFSGPMLDARAHGSATKAEATPQAEENAPPSGALWKIILNFQRIALAPAPAPLLTGFNFTGDGQGGTLLHAQGAAGGITLNVAPVSPLRRHLTMQAPDAGLLLRAANAYNGLDNGALTLDAEYGGAAPASGQVTLTDFHLVKAPEFTKIMQAITVYGLPAAASGPGLSFAQAVVPFSLDADTLYLRGARAFSSSLGFTATGSIGRNDKSLNIDTTIIPAYEFNAFLGQIPLLGHLFTAEKGGGLIAVRAKITGTFDDPKVSMNPFSAITPGVLRGIFGIGENAQQGQGAPAQRAAH